MTQGRPVIEQTLYSCWTSKWKPQLPILMIGSDPMKNSFPDLP